MNKIIIIAIVAVVLIGGGIGAYFMFFANSEPSVEELPEIIHDVGEQYTNIPVGDEAGNYKILKIQLQIVYTDETFTETFTKSNAQIQDFVNGYFRDTTLATVNRKNGKERIKEEITEQLIEMFETNADNIKGVLMPQFIIQ
ncbi:flagellar basal body-associated FliL family protein [Acidaminobacter sp. JC074]|uniref:flagellar basal body-associated FliL family protein n=1 Tax=Acidaminobacter sp. JC074 TaxID=2530199 RepID=UPI001F1135BD|nr:flagellar basal body-associated FliL family protein [Acidaminobacter sp. JC074]MCH4888730.1 flagellar basal body-associated FliL family protein [Acidaminobacter sp. JC074]